MRRGEAAASPISRSPVTITDVARLAGVSPGTASKALNGRGGISADTVERVRQAAERLGVAGASLFAVGGAAFETPARRDLLLLRRTGRTWELRRYRTAGDATVRSGGGEPSIRATGN